MIDLRNPVVQAKLLINERPVKFSQAPKNAYADLVSLVKESGGIEGIKHIIVNIGMINDKWESIDVILKNGDIIASSHDLKNYAPPSEVERIVVEVYEIEEALLEELEKASEIKVEAPSESYTVVSELEAPPLPRRVTAIQVPQAVGTKVKYPTDLLPSPPGEWLNLKTIDHKVVVYLESKNITSYAVATGTTDENKLVTLVYLGPEYSALLDEIKEELKDIVRDEGVNLLILKVGGREEKIELGG